MLFAVFYVGRDVFVINLALGWDCFQCLHILVKKDG